MARRPALLPVALAALLGILACTPAAADNPVRLPAPTTDPADSRAQAVAIFAGGCFWGVEGVFSHVRGVTAVASGYHGGDAATARYERINAGDTGHAEAVRVVYDPAVVSYGTLVQIFFSVVADPTTLNRQGPDMGSQYRSAIVPLTADQRRTASAYIAELTRGRYWTRPIVTTIENPRRFYEAEGYHQDFMARNPDHPYIRRWDAPKLTALRGLFPTLWRARPAP